MVRKVIFVADFFVEHIARGAEQDDQGTIEVFTNHGIDVSKVQSTRLSYVDPDEFYIISNFQQLTPFIKSSLIKYKNYLIYEHDFKFAADRNPSQYTDFIVPADKLVNKEFYNNAQRVICCTSGQRNIFEKNLPEANYETIGLSVYTQDDLDVIDSIKLSPISDYVIYSPGHPAIQSQKGTKEAIKYCLDNDLQHFIVTDYPIKSQFLERLGQGRTLLFYPQIYESCSRLAIEALMIGIDIEHNGQLGMTSETIFDGSCKGHDLVKMIRTIQNERVLSAFKLDKHL